MNSSQPSAEDVFLPIRLCTDYRARSQRCSLNADAMQGSARRLRAPLRIETREKGARLEKACDSDTFSRSSRRLDGPSASTITCHGPAPNESLAETELMLWVCARRPRASRPCTCRHERPLGSSAVWPPKKPSRAPDARTAAPLRVAHSHTRWWSRDEENTTLLHSTALRCAALRCTYTAIWSGCLLGDAVLDTRLMPGTRGS